MTQPFFTKRKFLQLDIKQRHKKCAQLLRDCYLDIQQKQSSEQLQFYHSLTSWMKLYEFFYTDLKALADRYHWHLHAGGFSLKEHNLLPSIRTGDHVPTRDFPSIAIYLDHVRSAYNVGSILRTTEALRTGKVYFSEKTPFIDNEKVSRTAMGAAQIVPCFQNIPLSQLPRPIIALDTSDAAIPIADFSFPSSFTLIL